MAVFTTEITSDQIPSDNPIHQRLLQAYFLAKPYINGDLLELGCGEGRGVDIIAPLANSFTAIDKIGKIVDTLQSKYPSYNWNKGLFPPVPFEDNSFDSIVSFQVIEHVKNDKLFLSEIFRILRPGGVALLTTPNIKMTLTRNPWHVREYTADELLTLAKNYFDNAEMKGVAGNEKIMTYYNENKESVKKITKYDFLDLQHRLPAPLLRIPYDLMNRLNRNRLHKGNNHLVNDIEVNDYLLKEKAEDNLDLFLILRK